MIRLDDKTLLNDPDYNLPYEKLLNYMDYTDGDFPLGCTEKAYITSNELLNRYFPNLNLDGKRVATVGSSGDQVLNALFYGAKDVTLIDANIFSQAYTEYKMALISTLDYNTFLTMLKNSHCFHWKVYAKISHLLSPNTKEFFDALMLDQDPVPNKKRYYSTRFNCNSIQASLL